MPDKCGDAEHKVETLDDVYGRPISRTGHLGRKMFNKSPKTFSSQSAVNYPIYCNHKIRLRNIRPQEQRQG